MFKNLVIENVDSRNRLDGLSSRKNKIEYIDDLDSRLDFAISESGSTRGTRSSHRAQSSRVKHTNFSQRIFTPKKYATNFLGSSESLGTDQNSKTSKVDKMTQVLDERSGSNTRCIFSCATSRAPQQDENSNRSRDSIDTLTKSQLGI